MDIKPGAEFSTPMGENRSAKKGMLKVIIMGRRKKELCKSREERILDW